MVGWVAGSDILGLNFQFPPMWQKQFFVCLMETKTLKKTSHVADTHCL